MNMASELASLVSLLAVLRALHWEYHTSHWTVSGPEFYGNHLMFERLYKAVEIEYDNLAEKILSFEPDCDLDSTRTMRVAMSAMDKLMTDGDVFERALSLEHSIIELAAKVKLIEGATPGLHNFIDELIDNHENHIYMLQQVTRK